MHCPQRVHDHQQPGIIRKQIEKDKIYCERQTQVGIIRSIVDKECTKIEKDSCYRHR